MNLRRRTIQLGETVVVLLLVVIVAAFVVYAVPDIIGAEHSYVVLSGSMTPTLSPGDIVIVDNADPATIEEGDMITYKNPEERAPTTHRVVDIRQGNGRIAFQTKGDANENPDPGMVPAANVIGTVILTIPHLGYVVQFANTTVGRVVLVAVPLSLLVLSEIWTLAVQTRQRGGEQTTKMDTSPENNADLKSKLTGETETNDGDGVENESTETRTDTDATPEASTSASTKPDNKSSTFTIRPRDLTVSMLLLVLVVPYAAYVAFKLRSALSFSVVFASVFLLLILVSLRVTEWLNRRGSTTETESENDEASSDLLPTEEMGK